MHKDNSNNYEKTVLAIDSLLKRKKKIKHNKSEKNKILKNEINKTIGVNKKEHLYKKIKLNINLRRIDVLSDLIGITLIVIGVIFLINPISIYLKFSIALILAGLFMIFLIFEKKSYKNKIYEDIDKPTKTSIKKKLYISDKIALSLIIWILFIFLITINSSLDIFIIIICISIIIAKEITDEFTPTKFKIRMNFFFLIVTILFTIIIVQKIFGIMIT